MTIFRSKSMVVSGPSHTQRMPGLRSQSQAVFNQMDSNHDGFIDENECLGNPGNGPTSTVHFCVDRWRWLASESYLSNSNVRII